MRNFTCPKCGQHARAEDDESKAKCATCRITFLTARQRRSKVEQPRSVEVREYPGGIELRVLPLRSLWRLGTAIVLLAIWLTLTYSYVYSLLYEDHPIRSSAVYAGFAIPIGWFTAMYWLNKPAVRVDANSLCGHFGPVPWPPIPWPRDDRDHVSVSEIREVATEEYTISDPNQSGIQLGYQLLVYTSSDQSVVLATGLASNESEFIEQEVMRFLDDVAAR